MIIAGAGRRSFLAQPDCAQHRLIAIPAAGPGCCACIGTGVLRLARSGPAVIGCPVTNDGSAMSSEEPAGVVFPASEDGRRSTSALGRAVAADALRAADPVGA